MEYVAFFLVGFVLGVAVNLWENGFLR